MKINRDLAKMILKLKKDEYFSILNFYITKNENLTISKSIEEDFEFIIDEMCISDLLEFNENLISIFRKEIEFLLNEVSIDEDVVLTF